MLHEFLKQTVHGPFAHQNGRSLYMIISRLSDSLCFKEVIMGIFVIKYEHLNAAYCTYSLKRSTLLKVKPLSLPQTVIWKIVESMFDLHHNGQVGEHHLAGLAKLWPCALSILRHREQQYVAGACWTSTMTSLWPAYEPTDCTGNIAWHLLFFWKACLRCWTPLHSVTLLPPCRALLFNDLWSWWTLQIQLWWPVKYYVWVNPSSALGLFSTCQWTFSWDLWKLCLVLLHTDETVRGQNSLQKWAYTQDMRKK